MTRQKFGYVIEEYRQWKFYDNQVYYCTGFDTKSDAQNALEKRKDFIIHENDRFYRDSKIYAYEEIDCN
ncbi:MAG: hypothetical protein AAGF26_10430 [Cyanobacteria bacterium P01_G01_bin.49]